MKNIYLLIAIFFISFPSTYLVSQNIIYVNQNAAGGGDGGSWATAYNDLQSAIPNNSDFLHIYVAAGMYKPTSSTDRAESFVVPNGIKIFGGFPNVGNPTLNDRDPINHLTILSGNIGNPSVNSDNSYHVVKLRGHFNDLNSLDGLIIEEGNANGDTNVQWHWKRGGGIFIESLIDLNSISGSNSGILKGMTFINCIIRNNEAEEGGGGVYVRSTFGDLANQTFSKCIFEGNSSPNSWGGAVLNDAYNGTNYCFYEDCVFKNNTAGNQAGAMALDGRNGGNCSPNISHCVFDNNTSYRGGALILDGEDNGYAAPNIADCTFANNSATDAGGAIRGETSNNGKVGWNICNSFFDNNQANGFGGGAIASWGEGTDEGLIIDCEFTNNGNSTSTNGGGAILFDVRNNVAHSTKVKGCTFNNNQVNWGGGAISYYLDNGNSTGAIEDCYFAENEALYGGAIMLNNGTATADLSITNCHFNANKANRISNNGGDGGALYLNADKLAVDDCVFTNNYAGYAGGGIYNRSANNNSTYTNCKFIANTAAVEGGGVTNGVSDGQTCQSKFVQCIFQGNTGPNGGGLLNTNYASGTCNPSMVNCTFYDNNANNGSSVYNYASTLTIDNSILWGGTGNEMIRDDLSTTTASASNIQLPSGVFPSINNDNINAAPLFTNGAGFDLSLQANSPCIDAGDNIKVPNGLTLDIVGNDRILGGDNMNGAEVDMGAYERDTSTQDFNLIATVEGVTCQGERDGSIRIFWDQNNIEFDLCDTVFFTVTGAIEHLEIHPTKSLTKSAINTVETYTPFNSGTYPFGSGTYYLAEGFYTITLKDCNNKLAETTVYIPVADHDGDNIADCEDIIDCDLPIATVTAVDPITCNGLPTGSLTFNLPIDPNLTYSIDGSFYQSNQSFDISTGIFKRFFIKNNTTNCILSIDTTIIVALTNCNFEGFATSCNDGVDNDGNGLIDCDDYGCSAEIGHFSNVQPPSCANGNDGSIRFLTSGDLQISIDGGNTYLEYDEVTINGYVYTLTGLSAGTHTFKTYNTASGCSSTESITFYCLDNPPGCTHPDFQALKDLFAATDGGNWATSNWDTSRVTCDPCAANWHGITCSDFVNRVTEIDLSGNNLNGTLPASLVNLTYLDTLDLSNNNLQGCIPSELDSFCVHDVFVDISSNPSLDEQDFSAFCASQSGSCTPPTCNPCDSIVISNTIFEGDSTFIACDSIVSAMMIQNGMTATDVTYEAGISITLMDGFQVMPGATFTARIEDNCTDNFSNENNETANSREVASPIISNNSTTLLPDLAVFPNPFSYQTTIQYHLPEPVNFNMRLYDINGRLVKTLVSPSIQYAGRHQVNLTTDNLQVGMYYVVMVSEGERLVEKVMVIK